jgi:hypothetical protein
VKINAAIIVGLTYDDNLVLPGTYHYCVKAVYGAYESIGECETVDVAVAIPQTTGQNALGIYPNPAKDRITLSLPDGMSPTNVHISVYDMRGNVIRETQGAGTKITMDVSTLPAGLYFIRVTDGEVACGRKVRID